MAKKIKLGYFRLYDEGGFDKGNLVKKIKCPSIDMVNVGLIIYKGRYFVGPLLPDSGEYTEIDVYNYDNHQDEKKAPNKP